ncbi:hypothetical protein [Acetobacter indonesiensis]|uniref:hypothetical protein n=1 Tax=Acetobacter indonesiensis TaxID=104101 RepID=UPI0020A5200C|nr:hypothetical protein [Acetobacter indonesiensis]MCP1231747.1 hypothetical protein [Acetobacter indonesiensis]
MNEEEKAAAFRADHGIPLMTDDDWQSIQWARTTLLSRVVAEIVKRLPENDSRAILEMIEGHAKGATQRTDRILTDDEAGLEEMMNAENVAATELANMIKTPYHHMLTSK